jgi:hypothetical protein
VQSCDKLTVKLLPQYRRALCRLSEADQESVAALVRRLVRNEAQRRGCWAAESITTSTKEEATC